MSEPFLTTTVSNMRVAVEVAWGADLSDADGSGWTWTDITADVILDEEQSGGISITIGRADESSETQTALMVCQLDNRDLAYSDDGMSANWPYVRRGTPVRVRVSANNGSTWKLRFQGTTNGFTPQWDPDTGRWATVELSASGPLRRLEQGTPFTESSLRAALSRDSTVTSYWPCEDPGGSRRMHAATNGYPGNGYITDGGSGVNGSGTYWEGEPGQAGAYSNIAVSAPILTLGAATALYCDAIVNTSTSASTTSIIISGAYRGILYWGQASSADPHTGYAPSGAIMRVETPNGGSVKSWVLRHRGLSPTSEGKTRFVLHGFSDAAGSRLSEGDVFTSGNVYMDALDGADIEVGLILTQSGGTTTWRVYSRKLGDSAVTSFTGSVSNSGSNAPTIGQVAIGPYQDQTGLSVGHVVFRNVGTYPPTSEMSGPYVGHSGESPINRIIRVAGLNGIHVDTLNYTMPGTTSIASAMGIQYYDSLTGILREAERTNQGYLFDGWGPGLTFITKTYRENAANSAATLVLDASQGHLMEPFAPIDDDLSVVNNATATATSGATETYVNLTGPRGVSAVGDYSSSIDVNPADDEQLLRYAEWRVNLGSREGYRYPSVSFALETNSSLIAGWLDCAPLSRIDVTNITSIRRQHPSHTIKLLIEGWQETITAFTWRVTANTSACEPWNVVGLAATSGSTGDRIGRLQTESSQLNANYTSGTTISVRTNTGLRWIATSEDADSFPFDISVGGVKATVTGITGTTSPQTFTLSAALPRTFTGSTTAGAGAPVKVWRPPVYAL